MEKYTYEGEKFLVRLYKDMHLQKEVEHSSLRSDKKLEKIRKYLEREERVHQKVVEKDRLDLLKNAYYNKYLIKEIPKEYIEFLDKTQYDLTGYHFTKKQIEEHKRVIIEDQKKSLDMWIDYLTSDDARFYPWWAKYWAFQGMLKIGAYDNENRTYGKRDETTVAPFIELNQEALAKAIDLVIKEARQEKIEDELNSLIKQGSFTKLYQVLIGKQKEKNYDTKEIEGKWIKYEQGDNYKPLLESLQGYNTGWCTAGEATCKSQIENGDFYVYYTKDEDGNYKVPRLAIRMDGKNRIGEIRGVANGQNVEAHLEDILDKKLEKFEDKEAYKRRINDSKIITYIYTKYENQKKLTDDDLRFIYEIDRKIEGFGYEEDPRIEEIKEKRDKKKDLAYLYDCSEEEIGLTELDFEIANEKGTRLKYYEEDLDLGYVTSAEGLNLPEIVRGNLDLRNLTSAEGLKLPEIIGGNLDLRNLTSAEGLNLPKETGGYLDLSGLENAKGLKLPEIIGGSLDLSGLKSAKGLKLSETISIYLDLSGLESAEGLNLPEEIEYSLDLSSLKSAEGLKLPEIIGGYLDLSGLENAKDLNFPETIGEDLSLFSLKSAEGLNLPKEIGGYLYLTSLESVEGLILPETIGGRLYLTGLKSIKGLDQVFAKLDINKVMLPEYIKEEWLATKEVKKTR